MNHIVLVGDSSLDNDAYVASGQAVIDHLRRMLPAEWKTTLLAVDGSTISGVYSQLSRLPSDVTHIVISVGGNDALRHQGILTAEADSAAQVIGELADIQEDFEHGYSQMLAEVRQRQLAVVICTIYYPNFLDAHLQRLAVTASTIFNDVILRQAFSSGIPILDLRLICNQEVDYANPIEPSSAGGRKIASAIQRVVSQHDFRRQQTEVYV